MEKTGLSLSAIAKILGSEVIIGFPEKRIKHLAIDTRTLVNAEDSLFFALKDKRDGHDFIAAAYTAGVRNFVINAESKEKFLGSTSENSLANALSYPFPQAQFFSVKDTFKALQKIAKAHREQFTLPIIGITGSNGKTLVKEWLYQLLQGDKGYQIRRNPKSFNSQIGLALSLWEIQAKDNLGIFEAGISKQGEMDALQDMMQPNIGILTNLGEAHSAGFASQYDKLAEKLKLFREVKTLIYSPVYIPEDYKAPLPGDEQFTWVLESKSPSTKEAELKNEADLKLQIAGHKDNYTEIKAIFKSEEASCLVPFQDQASLENVATCWATLLVLGYSLQAAAERLHFLYPVHMRMAMVNGLNHCSIIDDTYSADLSSLQIALDFLNQQHQHPRRTLILSDVLESGLSPDELYSQIAALVKAKKVNRFIGVGQAISAHAHLFTESTLFFDSVAELIDNLGSLNFSNESILIKGARSFGLERITAQLSAKAHDTVLEINLRALNDNLQAYRQTLKPGVKLMAMVKAFSYGSGSYEVANLLAFQKVDYLTVAYADEGQALRQAGINLPIMVMSPEPSAFQTMWEGNLEPEIYSLELLQAYLNFLKGTLAEGEMQVGTPTTPIHIKLDTGMHRLGFEVAQLPELIKLLSDNPQLLVKSIFTHLVGADDAEHDEFTALQIQRFEQMYEQVTQVLPNKPLRHVLNTAGISRFADAQFDMVRLGIGLYALDATFEGQEELQSVLVWKTTISQVKQLQAGETVGYGRRGKINHTSQIATVKVGYADGYSRKLGNGVGHMLINGVEVPTVGSICMDMCMLDITGLNVKAGDEVVIFDSPKSIQHMANQLDTIPYEVMCGISQRVKRIYFYE